MTGDHPHRPGRGAGGRGAGARAALVPGAGGGAAGRVGRAGPGRAVGHAGGCGRRPGLRWLAADGLALPLGGRARRVGRAPGPAAGEPGRVGSEPGAAGRAALGFGPSARYVDAGLEAAVFPPLRVRRWDELRLGLPGDVAVDASIVDPRFATRTTSPYRPVQRVDGGAAEPRGITVTRACRWYRRWRSARLLAGSRGRPQRRNLRPSAAAAGSRRRPRTGRWRVLPNDWTHPFF